MKCKFNRPCQLGDKICRQRRKFPQDRVFKDLVLEHRGQPVTVVEVGAHLGGAMTCQHAKR